MDYDFSEVLAISDADAMLVDFAVLDNTYAYWATPIEKVSLGSWKFRFRMCGTKTHMLKGQNSIVGLWNKSPTWIDEDTITPAISGYKKGRDIGLPGRLPGNWVWVELKIRAQGIDNRMETNPNLIEGNVTLGFFIKDLDNNDPYWATLKDFMYRLSEYAYYPWNNDDHVFLDIEQIEDISYSKLCPYKWKMTTGSNPKPLLTKVVDGNEITVDENFVMHNRATIGPYATGRGYQFKDKYITLEYITLDNQFTPTINEGTFTLGLTDNEKKFGTLAVFGPNMLGVITRDYAHATEVSGIPYRYVSDNTGWYLEIDTLMNKIVIPSNKLPYISDAWSAYKFREMEYDRNELARANEYARNKFKGDLVKGISNGAIAGGFAGTNSAGFGLLMGGLSFAGAAAGAYMDREASLQDNATAQRNKEEMMRDAVDIQYNGGYGYRYFNSPDYVVRVAMPIDDMGTLIPVIGYSCTGVLEAILQPGFIQGTPAPGSGIKGIYRDLMTSELQMGLWII